VHPLTAAAILQDEESGFNQRAIAQLVLPRPIIMGWRVRSWV